MKTNTHYTIDSNDKKGFPPVIDLQDRTYVKIKNWINKFYLHLSESLFVRDTVKTYPKNFGINDYGPKTRSTKKMRERVSREAEYFEVIADLPEKIGIMPGCCAEHLFSRIGAYIFSKKRRYILHNCLVGSPSKKLAPYLFLEQRLRQSPVGRQCIRDLWLTLRETEEWASTTNSVGEFWRYGRFVAKKGSRTLRVEVWYDTREWKPRKTLAQLQQMKSGDDPDSFFGN